MHFAQYILTGLLAAAPLAGWKVAGDGKLASVEAEQAMVLSATEPATAGAVSPLRRSPPGADAVLVTATAQRAEAGSLVFSIHDDSGETIGYWMNPTSIEGPVPVAAAIPLHRRAQSVRLFIGTHDSPSSARVEGVEWVSVRRGMNYRSTQYGAVLDAGHTQGQTFKATGNALAAVTLQIRQLAPAEEGDLRVRLYAVERNDVAAARRQPPLAEQTISRALLPPSEEDAARTLTVPLSAPVKRGRTYLIEFSCASPQGLLIWAGPDGYPDGTRFENGNPVSDWDLHMATYYAK